MIASSKKRASGIDMEMRGPGCWLNDGSTGGMSAVLFLFLFLYYDLILQLYHLVLYLQLSSTSSLPLATGDQLLSLSDVIVRNIIYIYIIIIIYVIYYI